MSVFTTKNNLRVLIGKSLSRTASVQINNPSGTGYIADGEIVVLNGSTDQPLTPGNTVADSPAIRIVQRSGSNLIFSNLISGNGVVSYSGKSGSAAQEQIYVLGYNGTSGSIDLTTTNKILKITFKHDDLMWSEQPFRRSYVSSGSTQAAVATDITSVMNQDSFNALMGNGISSGSWISAEMLTDSTEAAITSGGAATLDFIKGSANVKINVAALTNVAVGDYIGVAASSAKYKVIAINNVAGGTITLNMPFQQASSLGLAIGTARRITAANAATGNWGIKMTGLALTFGIPPYSDFRYLKTSFIVHPGDGFGSTALTKTQEASRGQGVYEMVSSLEYFATKFEGAQNQTIVPLPQGHSDAVSGTLYDCINIGFNDITNDVISGMRPSPQQLMMFLADGASQTTDIRAQLNPWMASLPLAFPNVGAI